MNEELLIITAASRAKDRLLATQLLDILASGDARRMPTDRLAVYSARAALMGIIAQTKMDDYGFRSCDNMWCHVAKAWPGAFQLDGAEQ